MIVFWILFLLIILISLMLAYLSMRDFEEGPEDFGPDNGLYLIKKPHPLTADLMDYLYKVIKKDNLIISLERLFKGRESALVIYGPKKALEALKKALDLLELEEYVKAETPTVWHIGTKKIGDYQKMTKSIFSDFPKLEEGETVWYQLILQPEKKPRHFKGQIRVVVVSPDQRRKKLLAEALQIPKNNLVKIPQPFSTTQMIEFYKKRSMLGRSRMKFTDGDVTCAWSLPASPRLASPKARGEPV